MQKIFLSIGSGPGIGLATAQRFAREGYRIVLSSRNIERLAVHASELETLGAQVQVREVDASNAASVAELVTSVGADLHVLHYNAAVLHYDDQTNLLERSIDQESVESLVSDGQVNISSALVAIKAALPALRAQRSGSILLTGGGFGVYPTGKFLDLSIGKAAIRATTQALFEPLKAEGIHAASVTVSCLVAPNSSQAKGIAQAFWELHAQPQGTWEWERTYN